MINICYTISKHNLFFLFINYKTSFCHMKAQELHKTRQDILSDWSLDKNTTKSSLKLFSSISKRNQLKTLSHYESSLKTNNKDESFATTYKLSIGTKSFQFPRIIPIINQKIKLRLDINKDIPCYIDKDKLYEEINKNTLSNFNNRYNIFVKHSNYTPSKHSERRSCKNKEWNKIFLNVLRQEKNKEMIKHQTHKSSEPLNYKIRVFSFPFIG